MEVATVFTIIELTAGVLKLGGKLYQEVVGGDSSADQLKQLNSRLQTLQKAAEHISRQEQLFSPFPAEVFDGTKSILRTLEECKEFLNEYDATLSGGSGLITVGQRTKYILGLNGKRVKVFQERINQHYKELDNWQLRALNRKVSVLLERGTSVALPATNYDVGAQQLDVSGLSRSAPQRENDNPIISVNGSNPRQLSGPAPALPNFQNTRHFSETGLISPPQSSQASSPRLQAEYVPPAALLDSSRPDATSSDRSYPPSISEQPDENETQGQIRDAKVSEPPRERRRVTMSIGGRVWTFDPNDYQVFHVDGMTLVEWRKPGVRIVHLVEKYTAHIPYSRPYKDECEISFLPHSKQHDFEVIEGGSSAVIKAWPKYEFSHKPDREKFQQRFRGRQYLKMIRAVEIRSKTGTLNQDVHLKVWRRNESDEEPTLSFAHHEEGQVLRQVEYKIRWFKKVVELGKKSRLILRVYAEESDLDYGARPEPTRRRSSWDRISFRRRSSSSHSGRSPSAGLPVSVLYDASISGIVPPRGMQELGYLDIAFSSDAVRESFLNACVEAHPTASRQRRSIAISHGSPSPLSSPAMIAPSTHHETSNQPFHIPAWSLSGATEMIPDNLLPEPAISATDQDGVWRNDGGIGNGPPPHLTQ